MPKEVLCPICGEAYNLADEQVGKKVRCRKCEHAFTAGGEPRRRVNDDEEDDARDTRRGKSRARKGRGRDDEDEGDRRSKKTKSIEEQAKPAGQREPGLPISSFVIMGVIVGFLVLCCGGIGLFWFLGSSFDQKQRPNNPPGKNQPNNPPRR
jgi:predicted Zn finger-like uncharacterized protein